MIKTVGVCVVGEEVLHEGLHGIVGSIVQDGISQLSFLKHTWLIGLVKSILLSLRSSMTYSSCLSMILVIRLPSLSCREIS